MKKNVKKLMLVGLIFIASVTLSFSFIFLWKWQQFIKTPLSVTGNEVIYELLPGYSLNKMSQDLFDKGIINSILYWKLLAYWNDASRQLKAGEYRLSPGITPNQFLKQLTKGNVIHYPITIVEGWTFPQVIKALQNNEQIKATLTGLSEQEIIERLGLNVESLEGRFFPETYHFVKNTTDVDLLKRSYQLMDKHLMEQWEKRSENLPYKSKDEALIAASLIEKEAHLLEERPRVAGVLARRLAKGMRLQIDATVVYGLGDKFTGRLTRANLQERSPYNTYVHRGLPPTPISLPSLTALSAAFHPAEGEELYFVAKGDGSHVFSTTLVEHNRAVQEYRQKENG